MCLCVRVYVCVLCICVYIYIYICIYICVCVPDTGGYTNCYTGNLWDETLCPDPETCTENCVLGSGVV